MKRTPSAMRGHAFHFLRYGIGFLVAHLLLIVLGLWAWDALLEDRTEAGLQAEMRGTHALLQHRFAETPREQWPTLARELDADFAYALRMVPLAEAMKALPASQRPPFSNGRVQIDLEHMRSLQRIGDSDYAVMLGPLDEALPDEGWQDSEVSGVAILLLILMVAVALPMYVMVYRLWRDVSQLAQAARQMRDGQLDTRAPRAGTALVRPLANAFNHMAEQLQQLLESQRVLAQAVAHEVRTPLARMRFGLADLEDTALDEIQRDALGGLRTDVDRLQHLTDAGVEYAALGRCHQLTRQRLQLAALTWRGGPVRTAADAGTAGAVASGPGQRQPAHAGTGIAQPARQCPALCAAADPYRQHGQRRLAVPAGGGRWPRHRTRTARPGAATLCAAGSG